MTNAVGVAYRRLLQREMPHAIRTRKDHAAALGRITGLLAKQRLAPEESEYLDLLVPLVEAYERAHVALPSGSPLEVLRELMAARGMKQVDLAAFTGSSGTASEICRGKREISKALAKKLGKHFGVAHTLFL